MVKFRVKELARQQGLTSEELAMKSGVKISTIRNLWQGRVSDAMYTTLAAVAQAMNVPIEDLIEEAVEVEDGGEEDVAALVADPLVFNVVILAVVGCAGFHCWPRVLSSTNQLTECIVSWIKQLVN